MKRIKTNFGAQVILLCVALVIALPVRVYQYLNLIDGTTGFYNTWVHPTVFGLYGLCAVFIIVLIALAHKGSKKTLYSMPADKHTALALTSVLVTLSFLAESAYNAYRYYLIANNRIAVGQLVLGDMVGKSTSVFLLAQVVFGLLSAAYFLALGISFFSGKAQYKKVSILAAAPVLWGVARLMLGFTQTISYRYVSELLFDLLMIVFWCLFAVSYAKFSIAALKTRIQTRIFAYGFLAVFFSMLSAVPRYIVLLMGRQDLLYRPTSVFEVTDIVLPVFIMAMIFAIVATKQFKSVEEYKPEEAQ